MIPMQTDWYVLAETDREPDGASGWKLWSSKRVPTTTRTFPSSQVDHVATGPLHQMNISLISSPIHANKHKHTHICGPSLVYTLTDTLIYAICIHTHTHTHHNTYTGACTGTNMNTGFKIYPPRHESACKESWLTIIYQWISPSLKPVVNSSS